MGLKLELCWYWWAYDVSRGLLMRLKPTAQKVAVALVRAETHKSTKATRTGISQSAMLLFNVGADLEKKLHTQ